MSNIFKGKKILVAGGTGLVGQQLVPKLIKLGGKVSVASLDDKSLLNFKVENFYNVAFDLQPVPDPVVWEGVIIKESMWAYPREYSARQQMRQCYTDLTGPDAEAVEERFSRWAENLHEDFSEERNKLDRTLQHSLIVGFDFYHYDKSFWLHSWGNLMPYHYDDGGEYSYHNFNGGQWLDYSGGLIFGYWLNKNLGAFVEGKYNKYWNREWHNFSFGINYKIF